ncbi:YicC/YloC family endoribonuclease [Opitutus sp. ER46]|uniref:YicC/YloC family endoribonuclease n=1 Tax=Opitutus sp. ER46 TaxID=2161864 RepID=UPI000D2F4830|nr:YicC/YloC family endoribonuclease [Opitutus sp. ER46]PTX91242.1 YicC family protein [Opitutus sp. ER46]
MRSMTGYGRATAALEEHTLTVQVSSVNRKTLDLTIAAPEEWEALEPVVAELVRKFAARGKVHVSIEMTGEKSAAATAWDEDAAAEALERLERFAAQSGVKFEPTAELLWEVANAQKREDLLPPAERAQAVVSATVTAALRAFAAMRAKEGESLFVDFIKRAQTLHRYVEAIAARAPQVPSHYREQLMKRLREAGLELDLNDERVLREIALFADRCDVSEEITRLRSHFEQFTALLKSDGEIGRKAEFLLQEIGREVNTIGSKANDLTIARSVIELKNELERIREQMANVE